MTCRTSSGVRARGVAVGEFAQGTLGVANLVTLRTRIEAQAFPSGPQACGFHFVLEVWIEPTENPRLALQDGDANDDRDGVTLVAGLRKPGPAVGVLVLVTNQNNGVDFGEFLQYEQDRLSGRPRVVLRRFAGTATSGAEVTMTTYLGVAR